MTKENQLTLKEKLLKIQTELKAPKSQRNKFGNYNYRNCEDILEAVKPLLDKYNCVLTIKDEIKYVENIHVNVEDEDYKKTLKGILYVEAVVLFQNAENEEVAFAAVAQAGIDPVKKGMDISQSFGSSSSYARKYALDGLFLIDDTKDADATNKHGKEDKNQIPPIDSLPMDMPPPREPAPFDNPDQTTRDIMKRQLLEMNDGNMELAMADLARLTAFKADDGQKKYCDNLDRLKGKWLSKTAPKVKQAHVAYLQATKMADESQAGFLANA